jgi:hypothetical protein
MEMTKNWERKSINRGFRLKPSVLQIFREISVGVSMNTKMEELILKEYDRLKEEQNNGK